MVIGTDLTHAIWNAVGGVVVLAILLMVIFKFFIGASKNIPAGIGVLLGCAVIIGFIQNPDGFIGIGKTIGGILTGTPAG